MDDGEQIRQEQRETFTVTKRRQSCWKPWLIFFILLGVLVIIAIPVINNKRGPHRTNEALSHGKQILIACMEFEGEHGTRPGQIHVDEGFIPGAKADTANDCFRQFFQGLKSVRSEIIFYAPSKFTVYPDNNIGDESNHFAEACAKGEVGFLFIDAPTAKDGAPMIVAPILDNKGRFDTEGYDGKAIIVKTDGSVEVIDIDADTKRIYTKVNSEKVDMLSSKNPVFRNPPVIKYPEPR